MHLEFVLLKLEFELKLFERRRGAGQRLRPQLILGLLAQFRG